MNGRHQTILRFTGGNSDKVWAYDHDKQICYYGRFGRAFTENGLPNDESQKRINSKLKKGYVDVSAQYYIEDRELHSADLDSEKSSDWVLSFENLDPADDLLAHINAIETSLNDPDKSVVDAIGTVKQIITEFTQQVILTFSVSFAPSSDILTVLTSLKTEFPNIDIVDNSGNLVQRDVLLSNINLSKNDLVSWLITQEIKVFNQYACDKADAYF